MKKIKHLAIGAGLALGLSAVVAPLSAGAAGAAGYPGSPFGQGASHGGSSRPTTPPATKWSPTSALTTARCP